MVNSSQQKMSLIPKLIFCPRCGLKVVKQDIEEDAVREIKEKGYEEAARYICKCGVVSVICTLSFPKSPTWTLMFDCYEAGKILA